MSAIQVDPPPMFRFGWEADFPDPDNFLNIMTTESQKVQTRWSHSQYDKLIALGAGTLDKDKRRAFYANAQTILIEKEMPVIPLYVSSLKTLISGRLKHFPFNSIERLRLDQVEIVK